MNVDRSRPAPGSVDQPQDEEHGSQDQRWPGPARVGRLPQTQRCPPFQQDPGERHKTAPRWHGRRRRLPPGSRKPGGVEQKEQPLGQRPTEKPARSQALVAPIAEPPGDDHQIDGHEQESKVVEHPQASRAAEGIGQKTAPRRRISAGLAELAEQASHEYQQSHAQHGSQGVHANLL